MKFVVTTYANQDKSHAVGEDDSSAATLIARKGKDIPEGELKARFSADMLASIKQFQKDAEASEAKQVEAPEANKAIASPDEVKAVRPPAKKD